MPRRSRLYGDPIVTGDDLMWAINRASRVEINGIRISRRLARLRYGTAAFMMPKARWAFTTLIINERNPK